MVSARNVNYWGTDSRRLVTKALDDPGGPFQPYIPKATLGVATEDSKNLDRQQYCFPYVKWKGIAAPENV